MDLVSTCKDKLAYFRIKELKDVLSQLGLAKQGKKQDLLDRILALLSDEQVSKSHGWGKKNSIGKDGVAKIIDDTYRKMQVPGAMDLASKSHSGSDFNLVKPKEEVDNSYQLDMKVRCPCGSSLITESMIKCEDPRCRVWQHIGCVIIPENPMEGVPPELPSQFFCDICRINRADPFWVTITHPLLPLRLTSSGTAADGTPTIQNMDRTFPLSKADREMLQRTEYDLQVWCILLNDKVPFRMQWPQHTELQVNCKRKLKIPYLHLPLSCPMFIIPNRLGVVSLQIDLIKNTHISVGVGKNGHSKGYTCRAPSKLRAYIVAHFVLPFPSLS